MKTHFITNWVTSSINWVSSLITDGILLHRKSKCCRTETNLEAISSDNENPERENKKEY